MERNRLQTVGGTLEIIAGALWLVNVLFINQIALIFELSLEMVQLIVPAAMIIGGVQACTKKFKKSETITWGIIDLGLIGVQFYWGEYAGLGSVPMVLLLIASVLFFCSLRTQPINHQEVKENVSETIINDPKKNQKTLEGTLILDNSDAEDEPPEIYSTVSLPNKLAKLKELYDAGIITQEEYSSQRAELIRKVFR